jgi:hypothetical protein
MKKPGKNLTILLLNIFLLLCISETTSAQTYTIGQKFGGGVIFYIDKTGEHGLIAARFDQSNDATWGKSVDRSNNPVGLGIGTGALNTKKILEDGMIDASGAAYICSSLTLGGVKDWFLPSLFEMQLIFQNKNKIGGFSNKYYWTSSVSGNVNVWIINLFDGSTCFNGANQATCVRAVRAF